MCSGNCVFGRVNEPSKNASIDSLTIFKLTNVIIKYNCVKIMSHLLLFRCTLVDVDGYKHLNLSHYFKYFNLDFKTIPTPSFVLIVHPDFSIQKKRRNNNWQIKNKEIV